MSRILDRVADASGALFVLLVGVGFAVFVAPHLPGSLAEPEAVVRHLRAHPPTTTLWLGLVMEGAGLCALVLFAARIAGRIRAATPAGWIPAAAVGLAAAGASVKLASFPAALAALHVDRYDAATVTALLDVNGAAVDIGWALDGAVILLLGLGALATGALPRWAAVWGVAAGLAVLVALPVPVVFGWLQLVAVGWLLATSGWLLVRGGRTPSPTDGEPAAVPA